MVLEELSNKLSKNISKNINLTKDQNEQMTYAIHVLISESIKFAFLILLFFFLHKMNFFFFP